MRDFHLEHVLESLQRRFCLSMEHAEVDAILQPFKSWLDQKAHHEAVRTHLATFMAVGCAGAQVKDHYEDGDTPDLEHTPNTWHRSLLSFGCQTCTACSGKITKNYYEYQKYDT